MGLQTSTLRPGFLVSLKTTLSGNVSYKTLDLGSANTGGVHLDRWETTKATVDLAEHEAAIKARSKARNIIAGVCALSAFGLLCPENNAENLERAIRDARAVADEFNARARVTRIGVYVMTGRIAPDDVEAVKAINSEVRGLLSDMQEGLRNLNVKAIREAASRARSVGQMLLPETQARIQIAIDAARESAKRIVKAGEAAALEVDSATIQRIEESRTAFLDLDEARPVAVPTEEARGLDLDLLADDDGEFPASLLSQPPETLPELEME